MRSSEIPNIPRITQEYDRTNMETIIRAIEQYLQELRGDVVENRDTSDKPAALAQRRHQFLLMGG